MVKGKMTEQLSKKKTKGKIRQRGKREDKQKFTKGKGKDKSKDKRDTTQRQGPNEWKRKKTEAKEMRDFHSKDRVSSWLGRKTMTRENWRLSMRERRSLNRSGTSVMRKSKEIMKDARVRHWKNLAQLSNLRQSIYVYDHESNSVRNPGTEIEWPIVWLLSAFHRKHIFVQQKIPETEHINNDAIRHTKRVEWTWALRKDSTYSPRIHIKSHEIAS